MAGDWIKVELVTPGKPEIDVLAELLGISVNEVLGGLVRLWIWADQQTVDGNAHSVTKCAIDRHSGVTGLAEAMLSPRVRWLMEHENGGFTFPNFDRHNGQTAKRRGLTAKRVAACKKRFGNAEVTLSALPREEKRREEVSTNVDTSKSRPPKYTDEDRTFAEWMLEQIRSDMDPHAKASIPTWSNSVRLMRERDGRDLSHAREVFTWAHQDSFWRGNILCPDKLREKYTQLVAKMRVNGSHRQQTNEELIEEALRKERESAN